MAAALAATATGWAQPVRAGAIIAAETPAPGDIPDTQAFVTFAGPRYSVLVPEGWARSQHGRAVTFRSNANSEFIEVKRGSYDLRGRFHAVGTITVRRHAMLGGAPATLSTFRSRSEPNPVTGKSTELDNALYTSARRGLTVALLLSAPVGADNADQWEKIARSFRWR